MELVQRESIYPFHTCVDGLDALDPMMNKDRQLALYGGVRRRGC